MTRIEEGSSSDGEHGNELGPRVVSVSWTKKVIATGPLYTLWSPDYENEYPLPYVHAGNDWRWISWEEWAAVNECARKSSEKSTSGRRAVPY